MIIIRIFCLGLGSVLIRWYRVTEDSLDEFLNDQIFSRYTFLFYQNEENSSPEEGLPLNVWMNHMLEKMRLAIMSHIQELLEVESQK